MKTKSKRTIDSVDNAPDVRLPKKKRSSPKSSRMVKVVVTHREDVKDFELERSALIKTSGFFRDNLQPKKGVQPRKIALTGFSPHVFGEYVRWKTRGALLALPYQFEVYTLDEPSSSTDEDDKELEVPNHFLGSWSILAELFRMGDKLRDHHYNNDLVDAWFGLRYTAGRTMPVDLVNYVFRKLEWPSPLVRLTYDDMAYGLDTAKFLTVLEDCDHDVLKAVALIAVSCRKDPDKYRPFSPIRQRNHEYHVHLEHCCDWGTV